LNFFWLVYIDGHFLNIYCADTKWQVLWCEEALIISEQRSPKVLSVGKTENYQNKKKK
jgi:hypothetical protein